MTLYVVGQKDQQHRGKWRLCKEPKDYYYSSASFYETGVDRFGFLTPIHDIGVWTKEPTIVKAKYFIEQ